MSYLIGTLVAKQFEALHETVPNAALIGFLVNPTLADVGTQTKNALAAAESVGQKIVIVHARTDDELDAAFVAELNSAQARSLWAPILSSAGSRKLVALAASQKMPTMYSLREFAEAGGLMSYGTSMTEAHHIVGLYAGQILKGEKPADLPVQQATKVEMIVNLKTAKALGLSVPLPLIGRADAVIE